MRFRLFRSQEGKYFLDENTILSELDVAQENLRRARDTERYSEQLEAKGYITKVQLEADLFARQKAEKDLDAARKKLEVLQNYTRRKMEVQLKADIDTAKAKCDAALATFNLDKSKLELIKEQIAKCTIRAKKPGQVVYANVTERFGGQETIIEEGTLVRERQVIVRLPNPDKMQVKAKVNEAKIALVSAGMPARIRLDAYPDKELEGCVESVSEYPAPGMWWASNVKEYDTIVKIDKSPVDLRPGYTADVTILINQQLQRAEAAGPGGDRARRRAVLRGPHPVRTWRRGKSRSDPTTTSSWSSLRGFPRRTSSSRRPPRSGTRSACRTPRPRPWPGGCSPRPKPHPRPTDSPPSKGR